MPSPKSASPKSKSKSGSASASASAASASAAAGAGAGARAGAGAENALKTYAIADPPMRDLDMVPRRTLRLPKGLKNPAYDFYRERHTTPNWVYITAVFGDKDVIVGVFNTDTNKVYHIRGGLIYPTTEAFGFKNTTLKNQGGGQKTRRRQKTRRS